MSAIVRPARPAFFLPIQEHINILGDPLYFEVIAPHFIMQLQEVECMTTHAPCLEVGKKRLWRDVGVKHLSVSEFPHPRILNDGEDELRSLSTCCLVGVAVGALGIVCPLLCACGRRTWHCH